MATAWNENPELQSASTLGSAKKWAKSLFTRLITYTNLFLYFFIFLTSIVYFVDNKMNQQQPWLKKTYPQGNYVFQQDSAPLHKAKITQKFIDYSFAEYWWALWPPASLDCNPFDYDVWGLLSTKVQSTFHSNIKALKANISKEWRKMSPNFVGKSCKRWWSRI